MRATDFLTEYNRSRPPQTTLQRLTTAANADNTAKRLLRSAVDGDIVDKLLNFIESCDPTQNKKFTAWLIGAYAKGGVKLEDLNRHGAINRYISLQARKLLKPEHTDINKFKSYTEFENAMLSYPESETAKKIAAGASGNSEVVYRDSDVVVTWVKDEEAACHIGRSTKWCTASRVNNQFNAYAKRGERILVFQPTKPIRKGEMYQVGFKSGEFKDESDKDVAQVDLMKRFPQVEEHLLEFTPEATRYIKYMTVPVWLAMFAPLRDVLFSTYVPTMQDKLGEDGIAEHELDVGDLVESLYDPMSIRELLDNCIRVSDVSNNSTEELLYLLKVTSDDFGDDELSTEIWGDVTEFLRDNVLINGTPPIASWRNPPTYLRYGRWK